MGLITLKEYALRLGKDPVVVRQKALRGTFRTARKIGRDWFIEESEPFEDCRFGNGERSGVKKRTAARRARISEN